MLDFSLRNPSVFCERGFPKRNVFLMVLSPYPFGFSRTVVFILPLLLCLIFRLLLLRFQRLVDVLGSLVGFPVGVYGNLCFVRLGRLCLIFQRIGVFKAEIIISLLFVKSEILFIRDSFYIIVYLYVYCLVLRLHYVFFSCFDV